VITDLEAAQLADAIYDPDDGTSFVWARSWDLIGVVARLYRSSTGDQALVFRGSETVEDWVRDFFTLPHTPIDHPAIGPVHAGAAIGLDTLLTVISPDLGPDVTVIGHSLGGMRAVIFGALMVVAGTPPSRIVTFGAPRPGFMKLADILAPVPLAAFRNGTGAMRSYGVSHDLVTDAILHIPGVAPYVRPREPQTDISAPPNPGDTLGPFAWHHSKLYVKGLQST
jgi:hypothetical protein